MVPVMIVVVTLLSPLHVGGNLLVCESKSLGFQENVQLFRQGLQQEDNMGTQIQIIQFLFPF